MEGHNPEIVLPLGFTFSFPMTQLSIDKALLNTWTKSYDIPQVVNRNPTEFLQNAIDAIVCYVTCFYKTFPYLNKND